MTLINTQEKEANATTWVNANGHLPLLTNSQLTDCNCAGSPPLGFRLTA